MKKTRYDERHTLFSRIRLVKGTKEYSEFYTAHPHYQQKDDAIRQPEFHLNTRQDASFKTRVFPMTEALNPLLKSLHKTVETHPVSDNKITVGDAFSNTIKALTKLYGAHDVGIIKLKEDHYYTHKGFTGAMIGLSHYGETITPNYTHAVVFLIPMNFDYLKRSPHYETMLASLTTYHQIAQVGAQLAMYIKSIGYQAAFMSDQYYLAPMVPLAYDAGLGQIGMSNHLVHPVYGNAIRLGAVFTTLKLKPDAPIDFGLDAFCKRCALCLMNCPMQSIKPQKRIVNQRPFYRFDDQSCFEMFVNIGTDCGICLQSCPYSTQIDLKTQEAMRNDPEKIDQFLKSYLSKTGPKRRFSNKNPLLITKGGTDGNNA